jgi:hypothetical protein
MYPLQESKENVRFDFDKHSQVGLCTGWTAEYA